MQRFPLLLGIPALFQSPDHKAILSLQPRQLFLGFLWGFRLPPWFVSIRGGSGAPASSVHLVCGSVRTYIEHAQ